MQTMVMYSREFVSAKTKRCTWRKNTFGRFWFRLSKASNHSTKWKFCTETWKVPTYSYIKMAQPNLETSMSQKLQRKAYCILRQAHRTTPHQKFGKINRMTWNLISGLSAVSFTRCAHLYLPSEQMTWMVSSKEFWKVSIHQSPATTRWICAHWSKLCCRWRLMEDLTPLKFWSYLLFKNDTVNTSSEKMEVQCQALPPN